MAEYSYAVDASVVEVFSACSKREREDLLRIFILLSEFPHQSADWVQRTSLGRDIQVKRFGRWLISFWQDDAVSEVRVLDVRKLSM